MDRFEVFVDGRRHRYGVVEDVLFELREGLLVLLALEPLVLPEEHPDREDHIHALVVVLVVVVLVRDAVDALELVRVPGGYYDLVGIALAVPLDPREVPDGAEEDLVEDYDVVGAVVELSQLGALRQPDAEELVDGAAVLLVVARQLVGRAYEEDCVPLVSMGLQV